MEDTKIRAKIYGTDGAEDVEFTIDQNSLETVVTQEMADKIGIQMPWEKEFKTKNGLRFKRKVGDAMVEVDGKKFLVFVTVGETPALGFDALESGGFTIDTTGGKLVMTKREEVAASESE